MRAGQIAIASTLTMALGIGTAGAGQAQVPPAPQVGAVMLRLGDFGATPGMRLTTTSVCRSVPVSAVPTAAMPRAQAFCLSSFGRQTSSGLRKVGVHVVRYATAAQAHAALRAIAVWRQHYAPLSFGAIGDERTTRWAGGGTPSAVLCTAYLAFRRGPYVVDLMFETAVPTTQWASVLAASPHTLGVDPTVPGVAPYARLIDVRIQRALRPR